MTITVNRDSYNRDAARIARDGCDVTPSNADKIANVPTSAIYVGIGGEGTVLVVEHWYSGREQTIVNPPSGSTFPISVRFVKESTTADGIGAFF